MATSPDSPPDAAEPLLSVVLPNHNHGRYLERALAALAAQDLPPDEIVVVEDASTDDSREVLERCRGRHPNIEILVNPANLGALRSLQRGLEAARGRYVYFAAADDEVLPGFFGPAVAMLDRHPDAGLLCAETVLVDGETGRPMGIRPVVRPVRGGGRLSAADVERLLRRADNFIHTGSSIFRRQAVLDKGGFRIEAGSFADGLLARKVALSRGLCFMPKPVSSWHIHSGGLSRATALEANRALGILSRIPDMIASDPDFPAWYPALFRRRWRFAVARLALEAVPPDKALLATMAPDGWADRLAIGFLSPLLRYRPGRLAMLAWLSLRLRPFRLADLALTAMDRRFAR